MNALSVSRLAGRCGCAFALSSLALLAQAQSARPPGLNVAPQPGMSQPAAPIRSGAPAIPAAASVGAAASPAPAAGSGATGSGAPNPAGLVSQFPAGLPSPNDTPPGSPAIDAGIAAPPVTGVGVAAPRAMGSAGAAGPYSAVMVAQSFIGADTNRDGELTRTEAQRLTIAPASFEEMDRNRDGVLSRFEYDDAVR